ncbi:MAG: FAD:protein FMN transferase [Dokdonella sp.]|uniref:FAD:protein FMN transferase n=1 Tax=Dokdonella sp. TaxID=2291710 RepID=UPI002C2CF315|nr:FAD:protein FMN transferase [Dokdonella sp.]HOX70236.1 FAD:protein FMN transferase [Dokdonella sp.]
MRHAHTSLAARRVSGARVRTGIGLILSVVLAGCSASPRVLLFEGESMGSTWAVRCVDHESSRADIRAAVEQRLALVDRQMSTWKSDSDLSRFNAAAAGTWHRWPPELFKVVEAALKLAADTDGAYDPTVGPLVDLWGFGAAGMRREPPDAMSVEAMRARTGWQRVQLDPAQQRALQSGGTHLDLSSIAPGFALDLIGEYLESRGITNYLVEVGGELRGRGSKPDGSDWQVAIQHPVDNDSADGSITPEHVIGLRNASLGSSGDYRHFFEDQGRRYAHRIDPRTGYPLDNGVASVTALSEQGIDADPMATALSVLGAEAGIDFARRRNIAALFIVRRGDGFEERMTPAFAALLAR